MPDQSNTTNKYYLPSEWLESGPKQVPGTPNPLQEKVNKILSPGGLVSPRQGQPVRVSDSFLTHPEAVRVRMNMGGRVLQLPQPGPDNEKWALVNAKEGYWENPQRVARYYNMIRAAPPDWQPPEWLDKNAVTDAYQYLRYKNNYKPWTEWQTIAEDDPAKDFFRSIPAPPAEVLWPSEKEWAEQNAPWTDEQIKSQQPFGDWNDLLRWQKMWLSVAAPQSQLSGRPELSRITSAAFMGAINSMGAVGAGAIAGGLIGGLVGIPGGPPGMLAGSIAGAAKGATIGKILVPIVFAAAVYQSYSGKEVPVMNEVLMALDSLAIGTKRGIGLLSQDRKQVFKDWASLRAAWQAGEATYAVSDIDAINAFARILDFVDFNSNYFQVDQSKLAKDNQVWKISQGYTEPVDTSDPRNAEALNWLREEILKREFDSNKEIIQFVEEFKSRYGDTAIAADLVYESILDPANLVSFASGKAGKGFAKLTGNQRLAHAFDVTTGNPIIDALPFGVQQLAEAVTGIQGSKGPLAALEYYKNMIQQNIYPASMLDMPKDMRSKYNELGKKGIKPDDIQVNGKVMTWTEDGIQKTFEASRETITPIKSVEDLSLFEKKLAGIDEIYGLEELRPTKDLNWIQRLARLTPESQAHVMLNLFHTQLATLMNIAGSDVDTMVKLVKQAAGLNPVAAGDLGEAILKSASVRAIQEAVKYAVQNNDLIDNMLTTWISAERPRLLLHKIAKALNETPGKVLDQLQTDPDALMTRLNSVAPATGDPRFIKDALGIFVGDDRIPWNEQEFQAQLLVTMADQMEKYLTDHFNLKPQSHIYRLGHALKGVQSLVLLGLNPAYFLNNYINNVVTRAAVGVLGYMTPRQINEFLDRFGITPPRIDTGVSPMGEALYGGRAGIAKAMDAGDAISKATKVIHATNNKLGIFSRLSSDMERMESRQSTVIAMKRFLGKSWKRGKGFRKLHPLTEATLDRVAPGMKEVLYQAVEAGLNMDEVEGAIFGEYIQPQIDGVADIVDQALFPNMPGMGKQLLVETGILDELKKKLVNVKDATDVDIAFDDLVNDLEKHIDQKTAQDIIDRAETVANIVKNERIPAVLSLYGDMEIMIAQHWIDGRRRLDELFAKRSEPGTNYDAWQAEYRAEEMRQSREWERVYGLETQTYAGIIKALGVESEYSKAFIDQLDIIHKGWKDFHNLRRKLLDKFFDGSKRKDKETYEQYRNRRNLQWNILQDELDDLYQKHYEIERKAQMDMDRQFAEGFKNWANWKTDKAIAWREKIRDIRYRMYQAQRQQRALTRNMNVADKDAAYVDFNPLYNRMIADMKQLEQDGAFELMNEAKPAKTVEGLVGEEAFEPRSVLNSQTGKQIPAETPPVSEAPVNVEPEQNVPKVHQSINDLANKYSIPTATKDGKPMNTVIRNVINTYLKNHDQPGLTKETDINSLDPETIIKAFEEHKKRHEIDKVKKDIVSTIKAQDIIDLADKQVREAKLRQAGQLNRQEIEEKFRSVPKITELEIKAVMTLMDLHADRWARQNGSEPSDATRDAWYATRIKDVLSGKGDGPSLEQQLTGKNDIERRNFLFSMDPINVDTTSLGTERDSIRNSAKEAYAKIANTTVVNVNDGREIKFRKNAIKKILGHIGANIYDIQVVVELPNIISNGIVLFSSRNNLPGDNATYHHYGTRVLIDGKEAFVRVIVREENGNLFYDSHVTLGEKIKETLSWTSSVPQRQRNQENVSKDILVNWLTKVKNQEDSELPDLSQNERGSVSFLNDGRAVIHALNAPDISTLVHEIGHIFRRDLTDKQLETVAILGGLKDIVEFRDLETKFWDKTATEEEASRYRQVEEMFAKGWERYLAEGSAPTLELRSLFKRFTDWILSVYKELRRVGNKVLGFEKSQIGIDIRAQINGVSLRDIFDSLLVDSPDRLKDYQQLLERKFEDVKNTGRNWRLDDLALKQRAEKELIADIMHGFESEEDARRYAEAVEYAELLDGTQIDPTAVYDALTRIAEDISLNPWEKEIKQIRGTTTIARGISNPNNQYDFQFKVMELDDVQASNIWVGDRLELNPEYPQELQPRERTEAQSISQIDTIARMLVPEELIYDARALDRGTPIVGPDNVVESGNGRTLAIKRASEIYPEKFQEYKIALIENAAEFGIDPAQVESLKKPVLVRERITDTDRIEFVNDANKPVAMRMNAMELAINDARLISDESLMNLDVGENETIEGALQAQRNTWFINRFLEKLSKNEAAELSNNGIINQQGVQRITNAIFAKVYPGAAGERLLRAFSMSMSSNVKAAENAIMASLPKIAKAEGLIASGSRKADLSITGDISIAVDKLANLRASNMSVSDYLGQMSFFGDELTPTQKVLLKFISEQRQPKRIREFLREYASLVEKEPNQNQMSLLGDMSRTKEDLLNDAIRRIEPAAEGLFATKPESTKETASIEVAPTLQVNQLEESEQGRPGVREDASRGVEAGNKILIDLQTIFDDGRPLPIDSATDIRLSHDEVLPEPQNVASFRDKVETFRHESKTYARQYVDWVLSGERGQAPEATSPLIEQSVINALADSLNEMRLAALEMSTAKRTSDTPIPEHGVYIAKVYRFKHGDSDIVAAIYKDGELIAYLPDNYKTDTFEVNGGNSRVLGLSPDDPGAKIYEVDGEIKTSGEDIVGEQEQVHEQRIQFSDSDIYKEAYGAYINSSFDPEKRATIVVNEYVAHMKALRESLLPYANTPEKLEKLQESLERYKKNYLYHLRAYLNAQSRTSSAWVVGPARFNKSKNSARLDIADRKLNEFTEWSKRAQREIKKEISPESFPVSSDSPEALSLLQKKLDAAEQLQKTMKEANKIVRKSLDNEEKIRLLIELGLPEEQANKLLERNFSGGFGFPDYAISNNNAEIRRLKARIADLSESQAIPGSQMVFDGGRIVDNADENRIQIFFDNKPDEEMRSKLKSRGFKWAPSQGAWQRQRNDNARVAVKYLFPDAKSIEEKAVIPVISSEFFDQEQTLFQSAPVNREIVDTAKTMGVTDNLLKAGYIDVDGDMLDLSNGTKLRVMQHDVYANKLYGIENKNYLESIRRFMNDTHAVRVAYVVQMEDKLYINIESRYPMTSRQIDTLEDQAYKLGAKTVDITYDPHAGLYRNKSLPVEDLRPTLRAVTRGEIRKMPGLFQEPISNVPLYGTPEPQPSGVPLHEMGASTIRPMLDRMKEEYKRSMQQKFKVTDLDPVSQREIKKWLGTVRSDMASTKLAAIRYGEQFRDSALLNYSRRYGVDNILDLVFPYQFWYTRTMMNWARRMIDKPGWFAMYARLQRMQEEMERKGMPTRLRGKVRFSMPWLPDWTGQGIWSDPFKQIFPFSQFAQPLEQYASDKNQIMHRAEQVLDEMVEAEKITYSEAQIAKETQQGPAWDQAVKLAEIELDKSANPLNMVGMMMQPALWWTIPAHIASGNPERISPLPITRTGQAIRTLGNGTIAEPVTDFIGGLMAKPEEFVRRKAGISEFGEWGDYYIDRMLSNMAAEGVISANEARIAMIQRQGPIFDQAKQRVEYEQTIRVPGTLPLLAVKEGAKPGEVLASILGVIFPGSLFPEGELKQRGLKTEYDNAWRKLKTGDDGAINEFFDMHPEYEARLALYDEPDQRLRQFLIDAVWERWFALDKPNRRNVVQALGQDFEDFLNKETRDEENIDTQLLADWAQSMGALLPKTKELEGLPEPTPINLYPPELINAITTYQTERDTYFPNYYALQENYYSLPAGTQRKAFLRQFPQLREYWRWKDQYKKQHPELIEYFDDLKEDNDTVLEDAVNDMDPVMMNQLFAYSQGKKLTQGGIAEMQRLYKKYGKPKGLTLEDYINLMARSIYR